MKPLALLAALLLLPASVAAPGTAPPSSGVLPYSAALTSSGAPHSSTGPGQAAASYREPSTAAVQAGARDTWQWPLAPRPPVLRGFDPPPKPWLSGHRGVDLGFAAAGAPVTSPAAGTVSFAGIVVDRPVITIDHGGGLRSSFEPVESTLAVGAAVTAGQVVGTALPGHCPAALCLHWGVRDGEEYVNPLQFVLDLRPSILLPLPGGR